MVTDVKYMLVSSNDEGVRLIQSDDFVIVSQNSGTFTLAAPNIRTLETQFIRDTGYSSDELLLGSTDMDAYVIAYVPNPFNYWTGKHLRFAGMP